MKRKMIYAALAVLALSAPAAAQNYGPGGLPPHEILTILRSTGLDPLGQPVRRGPNYVLRAVDERDREVSVVVSARSGDVLSVTPVQTASRMPPRRGGLSWGPYERMPPGYVPPGGYRGGSPVDDEDEDDEPISGNPYPPRPPSALPGAPPMRSSNAAPLSPRSGVIERRNAPPLSEPNVITADPDRSGMLPPPPERFPQRAAPAAPPKPVKRAAAAPPKQAPLPKPKPAAKVDAPPAPAPEAAPEPAQQTPPAGDETPH